MKKKNKVFAIVGPTASGKSTLSLELAKKLDGEIISADSRQIYKEFDIATAKPSIEEMQGIKHHMIDIVTPGEEFSVADFADLANKVIEDVTQRGKVPIVAGGTGLYLRTLLADFDIPRVEPDKILRSELEKFAKDNGAEALYKMLYYMDPVIAQKIHPNNTVKMIRAIEVTKALKMPMSQAQGRKEAPYDVCWIGLNAQNRDFLYDRVNMRVEKMMEAGLLEEAGQMFQKYGHLNIFNATIGYQELGSYFRGESSLDEAVEKIKQNSRHYAKRQLTWFRSNKEINWFDIESEELGVDMFIDRL